MTIPVTTPAGMLALQGDRVLVYRSTTGELLHVLTIVRAVSEEKQELRLVNRDAKPHKPDWTLTAAWAEALGPAAPNKHGAAWEVTVKS